MRSTRLVEVPFELVTAEMAASPFSAKTAIASALTSVSLDLAGDSGPFWREVEGALVQSFPSYSIDELTAMRDWLWFGDHTMDERNISHDGGLRHEKLSMEEYVRRLSLSVLDFGGNVFHPRMPPWVNERTSQNDTSDDARARHFWRWVTFCMPPDMIMAAHPQQDRGVARVETVSMILTKILGDRGYVEPHMHLGAALDFPLLWIATLHAISDPLLIRHDSFKSPGANWRDGEDLASLVLVASIARFFLAAYLAELREQDERTYALTFDKWLANTLRTHFEAISPIQEVSDDWPCKACREQTKSRFSNECVEGCEADILGRMTKERGKTGLYFDPEMSRKILSCLRLLTNGVKDGEVITVREFGNLQKIYADLTGVRARWPHFPDSIDAARNADPIGVFFPAKGQGERSSEMEFFAAALRYNESEQGYADSGFRKLFWQVCRIRCHYYRHLVQRPMIPGLQWFLRFYGRLKPARSAVSMKLLVESAANLCGEGIGLGSLEVRIGPVKSLAGNERNFRQIFETFEALSLEAAQRNYVNLLSTEFGADALKKRMNVKQEWADANIEFPRERIRRSDQEYGLVVHFKRDRGGNAREGLAQGRSVNSHADPSHRQNHGIRYAHYYTEVREQAMALSRLIARYPRVLYYFRGIDLSTDEMGMPTWVLKPIMRYVRAVSDYASAHLRLSLDENVPGLRTTVHVGEDFVHLLGGLRRIDEAITHLNLKREDRLGHAVALGIDAHQWAGSSSGIAVTRIERLFDLAWEWHFAQTITGASANRIQYVIEQISLLTYEIFGEYAHPTQVSQFSALLYNEDELRRLGFPNGPFEDLDTYIEKRYEAETRRANGDFRFRTQPMREHAKELEREQRDVLLDENNLSVTMSVQSENAEIASGAFKGRWKPAHGHEPWRLMHRYLTDTATFQRGQTHVLVDPMLEAESLVTLQEGLRRKISKKGLTIEINPSSNMLIGNLSDLQNHPLWRLKPPIQTEKPQSAISVCIGSDDPITFATDTLQEYQLIYDTLTLSGVSDADARAWMESARLAGKESRFTLQEQLPISDIWIPMELSLEGVKPLP